MNIVLGQQPAPTRKLRNALFILIAYLWAAWAAAPVNAALPVVAIHDSEFTRALEAIPASGTTPTGPGTTGFQWWPTNWHYFVMPDAVKEALRSDGTAFATIGDSNVMSGALLDSGGRPNYPIVISFASEAIDNSEIARFTNYVAAGGVLFVGSSSFTRNTNGTSRGDFAFAPQMGMHMVDSALTNWNINFTFTVVNNDFLVSHIPQGTLTWQMPSSSEEISWPEAFHPPNPPNNLPHLVWQVNPTTATVVAQGDDFPYILIQPYGKGWFIYEAAMQPLIGHGGWAPGMYAYGILRNAIQWAFQNSATPIPKLSPWPYQYNAAVMFRHDFEGDSNLITSITPSSQWEATNGARGDYFFCTGELRQDMGNPSNTIAALQQDIKLYGATISSHNGGLTNINPYSPPLTPASYDYWHWGPDEMLDDSPAGYASGQAFALASVSNSFNDITTWFGTNNGSGGVKSWVAPYFNATREGSLKIDAQLGVQVIGDDKLSPFPHWTYSTQTPDLKYPMVTLPVSDWFVGSMIAQSMEHYTSESQMESLVDYYYNLGTLINLYSHSSSDGSGPSGTLASQYVTYSLAKPRIWSANSAMIYNWWVKRSTAQFTPVIATNGNQVTTTFSISGASDTNTAVELLAPNTSYGGLQVLTNGVAAAGSVYRTNGAVIKVLVGTSVTNVQVRYTRLPTAASYVYQTPQSTPLTVSPPGVLTNDSPSAPGLPLKALLASGPSDGKLTLSTNGGFTYTPVTNFAGVDCFTYVANDGITNSLPATATLLVTPPGDLFYDNFIRPTNADPLAPWIQELGNWAITNGMLAGTSPPDSYGYAFYNNNWTDYSVQAQVQFSSISAFGGGIGGRLNPVTGAHYGAWIYPGGSSGGSNIVKLIKFEGWTTWSFTPMAQASLPNVGTGAHTLLLAFQGTNITVSFDGTPEISVADNNFDGVAPFTTGGITADMYSDANAYQIGIQNVAVTTPSSAPQITTQPSSQTVNAGANVNFNVVATGPSLNYQWRFGSSPIPGATSSTLTLLSVSNANAGTYTVVVSNAFGTATSLPATLAVNAVVTNSYGPWFSDNFTRSNNPGQLAPWTAESGTWTVTGGRLLGGTNASSTYASVYYSTNWSNYAVQAQFQFQSGGYGGGLAGRVNASTGARYAAWIYPDGSPGGPDVLKLIKFQSWTAWGYQGVSYSPMQQVSLPAVGTNWHTLKLAFFGNQIAVYYDTNQVISMADAEATPYLSGGIGMDMWTASQGYQMAVGNVVVDPLVMGDSYAVNQSSALNVALPGVLGNDTEVFGTTLTASLVTGPANGTLSLTANGGFVYTPTAGFSGTDGFVYQANDGQTNLGTAPVSITVNAVSNPPVITSEPASRTNLAGTTAAFNVGAGGAAPLTYRWLKGGAGLSDGGNVSGSATATLTLSNVFGPADGAYTVVVSNAYGSITSAPPAILTVVDPVITSVPASRTNLAGSTATFTVTAGGSAPLGYQWFRNGAGLGDGGNISGSGTATLTITNVLGGNNGSYTVVVSNAFGSVTSTPPANLTVIDPAITAQPASRTNIAGTTATFSVGAVGTSPSYQWFLNNKAVGGAVSATLTLTGVSDANAGTYTVTVSNVFGSVTSSGATLIVIDPPAITGQPASRTNVAGTAATFTVTATGTTPSYQWLKNTTNVLANGGEVSGANTATLTLASVSASDAAAYSVIVSNIAGGVTSLPATLAVTASTNPPSLLFSDNFTRSNNPGPLAPWLDEAGTWAVTGGVLVGGPDAPDSYAYVYITNSWSNYTAQAQFQFQTNGYGGGLGAYVNPATGAHYGAWIYPEGSPGGSSVVKLVKFQTWTTWGYEGASYTPMTQASLPGVGTNWHTLALSIASGQITVSFDSNQVISTTDGEATPYTSGAISLDMWTDATGYTMTVDNVAVNSNTNATGNVGQALPQGGTVSGVTTGAESAAPLATPAPQPMIQSVLLRQGVITLTWSAVPNQTYRVQYNDSLSSTGWQNLAPDISASSATATLTNAVGNAPQRFYRVMVVQ
jgi:hypothetical protein